jgi:hypothetical protein
VIAATNRDLSADVKAGRFREDLFYRLHVFPIAVPPLRERGCDVELLARRSIERYCARIGKAPLELTADCLRRLRSYHWPGNVRELENVIERAVIIAGDGHKPPTSCRFEILAFLSQELGGGPSASHENELREMERATLIRALRRPREGGRCAGSALKLGIPPSTLSSGESSGDSVQNKLTTPVQKQHAKNRNMRNRQRPAASLVGSRTKNPTYHCDRWRLLAPVCAEDQMFLREDRGNRCYCNSQYRVCSASGLFPKFVEGRRSDPIGLAAMGKRGDTIKRGREQTRLP